MKKIILIIYLPFLGFYLYNAVPGVSFGDSSEIITTSYLLSIPHPTGFPVYTMLAKFFAELPVGSIAFRYNFFSVIFGCISLILCFKIFNILVKNIFISILTLIIFGLSLPFYLSSTSAEIYTFGLFLFLVIVYLLLKNIFDATDIKEIYFCFFISGLFLSQSFFAITYFPFFIYLFFQIKDIKKIFNKLHILLFLFLAGFLIYIYIPLRILLQNYEFVRFDRFFPNYIFAKGYQEISLDINRQLISITNLTLDFLEYFNVGIIFIILGIIFLFKNIPKLFTAMSILLIVNLFFSLPASFSFDIHQFLIPTYFAFVVFVLFGITYSLSLDKRYILILLLFLFFFTISTKDSINRVNYKQKNNYLYNYAKEIEESVDKNSIIIASNSSTFFSFLLLYYQYIEKKMLDTPVIFQMFVISPSYLKYIKQKYKNIIIPDSAFHLSKLKEEELYFILPSDFFDFYYNKHAGMKFLNTISRNKITYGILNHYRCLKIVESIILSNYKNKNIYLLNLEIYETPKIILRDKFYLIPKGNLFQLTDKKTVHYQKLNLKNKIGDHLTSILFFERAKYFNLIDELKKYSRIDLISAKELNEQIPDNFLYFRGISDSAMYEYQIFKIYSQQEEK